MHRFVSWPGQSVCNDNIVDSGDSHNANAVSDKRDARNFVERLRCLRPHSRALAGGQNNSGGGQASTTSKYRSALVIRRQRRGFVTLYANGK